MKLSPLYQAILVAVPDLNWIYRFIPQLGRGRCSWVHGLTKTGQKISRFLKKGLIKAHTWLNDSEVVSTSRDRIYTVSQSECSCPEWKHRISQGKGYRHIPELFKGYVSVCKHQVQHWLRSHDVSNFSEFINIEDSNNSSISTELENLPEGIKVNPPGLGTPITPFNTGLNAKYTVLFTYWGKGKFDDNFREKRAILGYFNEDLEFFYKRNIGNKFDSVRDGIDYLMRMNGHKYDEALSPEEREAFNSLFWNEPEPEPEPEYPMQEYFEEEKREESKPTKKWFSLTNLQNQEMPF